MTRKDYIMIAKVLNRHKPNDDKSYIQWCILVESFSLELSVTNPRFDAIRFQEACKK